MANGLNGWLMAAANGLWPVARGGVMA